MSHIPQETTTKDGINILWDMYVLTDRKVPHNKPDIIVHDENTGECHIIDIAVLVCQNVTRKEAEKITKYRDLSIELQKCWNLSRIRTTLVVIGALCTRNSNKKYEEIRRVNITQHIV